jgi:thioredoxin reductase
VTTLKFEHHPIRTDVVIVGAGPSGLFQVFELGLLGLTAQVVDSLKAAGGQCVELYPDKPIYDIPAVPVCTGRELTQRLLEQIRPFNAGMHLGQEVTQVERRDNGRFRVVTSAATVFDAGALVIAAGVGSFQPRKLDVPGAAELLRHVVRPVSIRVPEGRPHHPLTCGCRNGSWQSAAIRGRGGQKRVLLHDFRDTDCVARALLE